MSANRQADTTASPWRAPLLFAAVILLVVFLPWMVRPF